MKNSCSSISIRNREYTYIYTVQNNRKRIRIFSDVRIQMAQCAKKNFDQLQTDINYHFLFCTLLIYSHFFIDTSLYFGIEPLKP